jgi:deoxyribonuclease V
MTESEAMAIQETLRERVVDRDDFPAPIATVAGADVEYDAATNLVAGAIVVLDARTRAVRDAATHVGEATFPYVPGLFSFREMPPLLLAFAKLKTRPDVVICDGHGIAHPRRFGLACHLGVTLDIPTIGCGKTRLVGTHDEDALLATRGASVPLTDERRVLGAALRTRADTKPVFVSVGHRVSLATATQIVLSMCDGFRLPETTRQADRIAREALVDVMTRG